MKHYYKPKMFKMGAVHDYVGIKVQGERFNPAIKDL
jgi:hypothetical protein